KGWQHEGQKANDKNFTVLEDPLKAFFIAVFYFEQVQFLQGKGDPSLSEFSAALGPCAEQMVQDRNKGNGNDEGGYQSNGYRHCLVVKQSTGNATQKNQRYENSAGG